MIRSAFAARVGNLLGLLLSGAVLVAACTESRPAVSTWQTNWVRVTAGIPSLADVQADAGRDVCTEGLVFIRGNRASLMPTPDAAVDDPVDNWAALAAEIFFECPPTTGFVPAYETLKRLEAEINTVLKIDSGS